MSRIFPYDEWASSPSQTSADSFATPYTHDSRRKSMSLPFRKRLQSLPLVGKDWEVFRSPNTSETGSSSNHLAPDDGKKVGGIAGLFRKASVSIKNRQRRHSHAVPSEERPQTESPWRRLKTATSFHRHSKFLSANDTEGLFDTYEEEDMHVPIPGNGSDPPRIPRNHGGAAARATAARQNELLEFNERNRLRLNPPDALGDRESGIGIIVSMAEPIGSSNSAVSRVDFITGLPAELAIQILANLSVDTLFNTLQVSRTWYNMLKTPVIWREVFLREQTKSYATGKPVPLGAGLGLPSVASIDNDWKDMYRIREELSKNWRSGTNDAYYLHGHLDSIYCVQFDEDKIITGSRDKTFRVWNLRSRTCELIIGPPDVVGSRETFIKDDGLPLHFTTNYNAENQDQVLTGRSSIPRARSFQMHHEQSILCLQYDKEILVTGSSDSTCIVYDIKKDYEPIRRLRYHTAAVLDLAFDDKYIVTCSKDISICVWDRHTGAMLKQLKGHTGPVNAVSLRGNTIVSCSGDFKVMMWSISEEKIIQELVGHTKGLACSQFSEDSRWIASAGNDKNICIWDANQYTRVHEIPRAHQSLVRSLYIDSISGRLVSGSYDGGLKVFDLATGLETINFPQWHASWVLGAKSDYRHIISTGQEPKILIMDFGKDIDGIDRLKSSASNP